MMNKISKAIGIVGITLALAFSAKAQTITVNTTVSYQTNGTTITLNPAQWTFLAVSNNINYFQVTAWGTTDSVTTVSPPNSNALVFVVNTSPTNSGGNSLNFGSSSTNYTVSLNPLGTSVGLVNPDAAGRIHYNTALAGGTQTFNIFWAK